MVSQDQQCMFLQLSNNYTQHYLNTSTYTRCAYARLVFMVRQSRQPIPSFFPPSLEAPCDCLSLLCLALVSLVSLSLPPPRQVRQAPRPPIPTWFYTFLFSAHLPIPICVLICRAVFRDSFLTLRSHPAVFQLQIAYFHIPHLYVLPGSYFPLQMPPPP
jgi:hypothetical protein